MVSLNHKNIEKVAQFIGSLPENGSGLNFYSFKHGGQEIVASDMYPPLNHPLAIHFFFFVCMHQFGFWYGDYKGYVCPLLGTINGKTAKGSDLLWKVAMKAFNKTPEIFRPVNLVKLDPADLAKLIFSDDNGPIPFPDFEKRFVLTRAYAENVTGLFSSLIVFMNIANRAIQPLEYFINSVSNLSGYRGDFHNKKSILLAMALANRPERFLKVPAHVKWPPIIDYHLMRLALRLGLVDLNGNEEINKSESRGWVNEFSESSQRSVIYDAVCLLIKKSGRPMSFVDLMLWNGRKYCPEMSEPDCEHCPLASVCEKRTKLFQPVYRTSAY